MQYEFKVSGDNLKFERKQAHEGNVNTYICKFEFNSEWDGMAKYAVFIVDETTYTVLLEGDSCAVPAEAVEGAGYLTVGVYGTQGEESAYKRISTGLVTIEVRPGACSDRTAPIPPTPDIWAQYLAKVQALATQAEDAESGAIAAETEAIEAENSAKAAAQQALSAQTGAQTAAEDAQAAAGEADGAKTAAQEAAAEADTALTLTEGYKNEAISASADAYVYKTDAENAKNSANTSKQAAETAAENAQAAAAQAAEDAALAETAKTQAQTAANTAGAAAAQAAQDADAVEQDKGTVEAALEDVQEAVEHIDSQKAAVDSAKESAESAAASAMESAEAAENALEEIEGATVNRYGVKFGGSANSGETVERLYNAYGLTANVGTDTETAINDFDSIYPWAGRRRCCGYFNDDGNFVINAYEGEPGYATDGTNGEVWVETPLFYYKHTYGDDGSEEIVISTHPIGGYLPSPIHINADGTLRQKAYTAAYPMGLVDGMPTSRSGLYAEGVSLNTAMTNARKLGAKYTTKTTAEQYTKCLLMWVEFATRNLQSKMMGCSTLRYSAEDTATVAEEAANRVILAASQAQQYVVGGAIRIGVSQGDASIANNRTVTAIESYDGENSAIVFDGDPVDISVGNFVSALPWKTGSCDNVLSSSGSLTSNTSGKYPCIYRGEETPYGDAFEWVSDILFQRTGEGTGESPYTYDIYFLPDATKYNNGNVTDDYVQLNYQLTTTQGYVKKLGLDSRYPWVRLPCETGGTSTTYYADYCYCSTTALKTAAHVGGGWYSFDATGPCNWYCTYDPASGGAPRRGRLSYRK